LTGASVIRVFIGVGSNVDPVVNLKLAISVLGEQYGALGRSSVYQNPAVGFAGEDFLNMAVSLSTHYSLSQVKALLDDIHARVGRVSGQQKFGPRKLDLDLLLFGDRVDSQARVPRADVLRYGFVLGPMAELVPDLRHPVTGVTMAQAWSDYPDHKLLQNLGPLSGLN
jgi:2-amino-4-hydroxy-6-hydroxymethyldihydropteridine diphosphokinase